MPIDPRTGLELSTPVGDVPTRDLLAYLSISRGLEVAASGYSILSGEQRSSLIAQAQGDRRKRRKHRITPTPV